MAGSFTRDDELFDELLDRWERSCAQGSELPVEELCRDYPHLLDRLRQATVALRDMDAILQPEQSAGDEDVTNNRLAQIPGYEVLQRLGYGGMGVVYQARHLALNRIVALKVVAAGAHASPRDRARFRAEAEAVARVKHPQIVQIYDVGEHEVLPYYAMEFVAGQSLARKLTAPMEPEEAAALIEPLARAVHAVHEQGVVHRDLKPSNILIADDGTTKIVDFGLARELHGHDTASGSVQGTPSYMAPEQAAGKADLIGRHTDVYGLGAVLYELLSGRPPFQGNTNQETISLVIRDEPAPIRRLQAKMPAAVEAICLKCLQKEPKRRYASCLDLAEDLSRFLRHEPVMARPVSGLERVWLRVNRNPTGAALLCGMITIAILATTVTGHFAVNAVYRAREAADAREEAELKARQVRQAQYLGDMTFVQAAREYGQPERALAALKKYSDDEQLAKLCNWEWGFHWALCQQYLREFAGHDGPITSLAIRPDGAAFVTVGYDGRVNVWNVATGKLERTLSEGNGRLYAVVFSSDGEDVLWAGEDGIIRTWSSAPNEEPLKQVNLGNTRIWDLAGAPHQPWFVAGLDDGTVAICEPSSQTPIKKFPAHGVPVRSVGIHPGGRWIATAGQDGCAKLWDRDGNELLTINAGTSALWSLAFTPDGSRIAIGAADGTVRLCDAATGQVFWKESVSNGPIWDVAFSPDNVKLAIGTGRGAVEIWNVADGRQERLIQAHDESVFALAFNAIGSRLITAGADGLARLWGPDAGEEAIELTAHEASVEGLAFTSSGQYVASVDRLGVLRVWETQTLRQVNARKAHDAAAWATAAWPGNNKIATASADGKVKLWNVPALKEAAQISAHDDGISHVAFHPAGQLLATSSADGTAAIFDMTGREVRRLRGHDGLVYSIAFSPDGSLAATAGQDGTVRVWDTALGRQLQKIEEPSGWAETAIFSPNGQQLAWGGRFGTLTIYDLERSELLHQVRGHTDRIYAASFAPDGVRLATGGGDANIKVWAVDSGHEVLSLRGHQSEIRSLAFSPDGHHLVSGDASGAIRVWTGQDDASARDARREAAHLVRFLLHMPLAPSDVAQLISADSAISEDVRSRALALAVAAPAEPDPALFCRESWRRARQPHLSAVQYSIALMQAQTAHEKMPEVGLCLTSLGAAQYRTGDYRAAAITLAKARELNDGWPGDIALMAMVEERAGNAEPAVRLLEDCERAVVGSHWVEHPEVMGLLNEAQYVIRGARKAPRRVGREMMDPRFAQAQPIIFDRNNRGGIQVSLSDAKPNKFFRFTASRSGMLKIVVENDEQLVADLVLFDAQQDADDDGLPDGIDGGRVGPSFRKYPFLYRVEAGGTYYLSAELEIAESSGGSLNVSISPEDESPDAL